MSSIVKLAKEKITNFFSHCYLQTISSTNKDESKKVRTLKVCMIYGYSSYNLSHLTSLTRVTIFLPKNDNKIKESTVFNGVSKLPNGNVDAQNDNMKHISSWNTNF